MSAEFFVETFGFTPSKAKDTECNKKISAFMQQIAEEVNYQRCHLHSMIVGIWVLLVYPIMRAREPLFI